MTVSAPPAGVNRIPGRGRSSPARAVSFTFDGRNYSALVGDTLAAALLANGVHLTGRSFKYHRPRGILSAGVEEPNALVGIGRDTARFQPNVRASVQEVFDGLIATSQNRLPSLAFDIGALNDLLGGFFPSGFYYKTFMWPAAAWRRLYEPFIRAAAGLGVAPKEADPDRYANRFAHCDLLVVGAGPAGLIAALGAARAGRKVILCDENAEMGGSLLASSDTTIDARIGHEWAAETVRELAALDNVTLLRRTTAFGYYAHNMVAMVERVTDHLAKPDPELPRERLWQVRAGKVVLAAGAIERHIVFPDNDRPGIMLASAGRTYLNRYGVTPGRKIGIYAACDSAWAAAFDLHEAGIEIVAIVDCRHEPRADLLSRASGLGIRTLPGHAVTATAGRLRVRSMTVSQLGGTGSKRFEIDCLLVSGGWTPSVHLFSQSRGKLRYDAGNGRFLPDIPAEECVCVGACNGALTLDAALAEGAAVTGVLAPEAEETAGMAGHLLGAAAGAGRETRAKAFVDFQNDVTAKDIRLAVREGFRSIEHVKRYTTTGMATDQGKMSNMHGLAIAAEARGTDIPAVGLSTFRPPYTPVTFGAIANHARGDLFDVTRRTPIHDWAEENGAVFEDVGQWKRAWYFPHGGEDMTAAVNRECRATRQVAGIFDGSTLGKIEVVGPDAVRFLNLLYTNSWNRLDVGRCRYGVMLREDGFIYDDGIVGRLAEDRFHVTTTTAGARRVLNHMEDYLQTEFPHLKVWLTSTTDQWAVVAVQGPKSREIIAPLVDSLDLDSMPHMSIREGRICGVPTRLMRVSFTGELGFEINVPADFGRSVWEAVWHAGAPLGMVPYGTEAMHVMRAEKGFIVVGQDTDGTVTPDDAGLGWVFGRKKVDFIGIRGLARPDLVAGGRRHLVGLKTENPKAVLEEGAQIVADPRRAVPMTTLGFVTSAYWSENCGHSIALALIENGRERMGETLYVPMRNETIAVEVTGTVFIDPQGERLNG